MTSPLIYSTGTVTLENGSAEIVGDGTAWELAGITGGVLAVEAAGNPLVIASVESDTEATAATVWEGASGTYNYAIALMTAEAADPVFASRLWSAIVRDGLLASIPVDGAGTLAERNALDPAPAAGYLWLRVETGSDLEIYKKTGGGWDGPFNTRGLPGIGSGGLGLPSPGAANQYPYYSAPDTITLGDITEESRGLLARSIISVPGAAAKLQIGETPFTWAALNVMGRAMTGTGAGWYGLCVTNTVTDNTAKGGAVLVAAPYANANSPFVVVAPYATASTSVIYYGGGGWAAPDATSHLFYAGAHNPATNNTSTLALSITDAALIAARQVRPSTDNTYSLGTSSLRWSVVYSNTGTINTSDERLKTDIVPVSLGLDFVRDLEPVAYRWKTGGHDIVQERVPDPDPKGDDEPQEITVDVPVPRAGGRTHYGLLAQQVKAALDAHGVSDFAGWTLADKDDPDSEQGLRYDQFVPILIRAVQELAARVEELEAGL